MLIWHQCFIPLSMTSHLQLIQVRESHQYHSNKIILRKLQIYQTGPMPLTHMVLSTWKRTQNTQLSSSSIFSVLEGWLSLSQSLDGCSMMSFFENQELDVANHGTNL
jgi:hypothetical protein